MADRRLGLRPARAICVCVPSPQSNSSHSPSRAMASALTPRFKVGLPELVPSGMTRISYLQYHIEAEHFSHRGHRRTQTMRRDDIFVHYYLNSYFSRFFPLSPLLLVIAAFQ